MSRLSIRDRASVATHCIEQAWEKLRRVIPGLPPAVIIVLCAGARIRRGHFAASSWKFTKQTHAHEIGINPDLFNDRKESLATLVHEAAHALLFRSDGTGGCSSDGYYHKKEFRDTCNDLGLHCTQSHNRYGWCITSWPDLGRPPEKYRDALDELKSLPAGTRTLCVPKAPVNGRLRLTCRCGRSIYASQSVAEGAPIICSICKSEFGREKTAKRKL